MSKTSKVLLTITGAIIITVIACFINRFFEVKYALEHDPLNSNPEVYKYTKVSQMEEVVHENYDLIIDTIKDIWNDKDIWNEHMYYDINLFDIDEYLSIPDDKYYKVVKKYEVQLREIRNATNMDFFYIEKDIGEVRLLQNYVDTMDIALEVIFDFADNWSYRVVNGTEVKHPMVKLYDLIYNKHF